MSDLVTVATFRFPTEAQAAKLRLEAEGLTPSFSDAEIVNMDWLLGNAVGYIKLQVPLSQAGAAADLLEQVQSRPERLVELTRGGLDELRREISERSVPSQTTWWGYDVIRIADPDGKLLFPVG